MRFPKSSAEPADSATAAIGLCIHAGYKRCGVGDPCCSAEQVSRFFVSRPGA
jgi:hypothetical protein